MNPVENVALHHWPKQLRVLDDLLCCGICYEYMQNAVITPCSHNFCSACIRTSLTYRNECPSCHTALSDGNLHPNRIVDAFSEAYNPIRNMVLSLTLSSGGTELHADGGQTQSTNAKSSPSVPVTCNETKSPPEQTAAQSPQPEPLSSKVPCPVCSVEIKEVFINSHLDSCLKRASTSSSSTQTRPVTAQDRKPLPKLVYSLLSEKELRKKLKDLGLSTKGDKKTLEKRHQRFTILYNAERDSAKSPRSNSDLIREIEREEAAERKHAGSFSGVLRTERNADESLNEQERHRYLQENSSQFRQLVEQAKRVSEIPQVDAEDSSGSEVVILENVPKKEKIIEEATIDDDDYRPGSTSKDSLFTDGEDTIPFSPVDHERDQQDDTDVDSDATEPDWDLMNKPPSFGYEDTDPAPAKKARTTLK